MQTIKKGLKNDKISFPMFHDTSSKMIEGIDGALTDVLDCNKAGRMAHSYVDGAMLDYAQRFSQIDAALAELESTYDLPLSG